MNAHDSDVWISSAIRDRNMPMFGGDENDKL